MYSTGVLHSALSPFRTLLLTAAASVLLSACGAGSGSDADGHSPVPQMFDDAAIARWSDRAAWGGALPQTGDDVVIPAGQTYVLDTNVHVQTITVNGKLVCDDTDLTIKARWIMVHGVFECGTDSNPYQNRMVMTLTGSNRNESVMGMGSKFLAAMNGGLISIHGEQRTSWLMLSSTANPGDTSIQVENATNWRKGDSIVIASTSLDMEQAEVRRIVAINGRSIELDQPLKYRHFGELQNFSNGNRNWEVDARAEVALLTRNIRIQGDTQSSATGFGGHIMIMKHSIGLFSGVELFRMGQSGILARYPFHWHLADNVAGQYFRNSTIRKSFSRCVTIHGSHNALVEDNVCYDHIGHGYFLEDGVETGNTLRRNLGLLTRKPSADIALIPSDRLNGPAAKGPSTFWISNGDNKLIGNAAAGSEGLGFWYDTKSAPSGSSAAMQQYAGVSPRRSRFDVFRNNRVHSSAMGFSSCSQASGPVGYMPPNPANYQNLTVFASGDGTVWPCQGDQTFTNMIVTDSGRARNAGFVAPRPVTVRDSLFVANSALSDAAEIRNRAAIGLYDFGAVLENLHFVNYDEQYGGSHVFSAMPGDVRFTNTRSTGLTFDNAYLLYDRRERWQDMEPSQWGAVVHDLDGSLGLGANTALVADHPLMTDSTCTDNYATGRLCNNRYGRVEFDFGRKNLPAMTHTRSDGIEVSAKPDPERGHYQSVVSVNHNRYHYGYRFDNAVLASGYLNLSLQFLKNNDSVVIELQNLPASIKFTGEGYSTATSLHELVTGAGRQILRAGDSLYIKMRASGPDWQAEDKVALSW